MENTENVSKNTLKKRRQRANMKKDPEKLAKFREKERLRISKLREEKKAFLDKHPRLKEKERGKKREAMAAFREKKKKERQEQESENIGLSEIETGRSEAASKREKRKEDRLRKKEQALKKKEEELKKKEEVLKKHQEVQRVQKWRLKVKLQSEKNVENVTSTSSTSPFSSPSTEKRVVKRTKTVMPKTPEKRARVIEKLAESPSCKAVLHKKGVILTKKGREEVQKNKIIVESLKKNLQTLKPKGGMSTTQRRAYAGLKKIYSSSKSSKKIRNTNEKWWILQRKTRKDIIPTAVRNSVKDFYLSPGISREVPEKKSVIKLKNGQKVQRHNMTMTLADAFSIYKQTYPDHKIGFTKFRQLRPVQVKRIQETARKTCLCQKCCNTALKTDAIKKVAKNLSVDVEMSKQRLVDMTLCRYETKYPRKECIERKCDKCGPQLVSEVYYKEILEIQEEVIQWYKWEPIQIEKNGQTKRVTSCVMKETSPKVFLDELHKDLHELSSHLFTAEWQHDMMKSCIESGNTTVVMDFAENYSCHFQNEIQSGFFDQAQVVIHPMMAYYEKNEIKYKHSIIGITEDVSKDAATVEAFEDTLMKILQQNYVNLNEVHEWTDGCAAQYKGKSSFYNIAKRRNPAVVRNYFETSHGKSVCDGLGAVTKNCCAQAVVSGKAIISGAKSLYEYCASNLVMNREFTKDEQNFVSKREFVFLESEKIKEYKAQQPEVKTVPGTRKFHSVKRAGEQSVATRHLSCYCQGCLVSKTCENEHYATQWLVKQVEVVQPDKGQVAATSSTSSNTTSATDLTNGNSTIDVGSFVAIKIEQTASKRNLRRPLWVYVAEVLEYDDEEVYVKFMRRSGQLTYTWTEEKTWQPSSDVLLQIQAPVLLNEREQFLVNNNDIQSIMDKYGADHPKIYFK